jgi:hypothetical protein
MPDRVSVFFQVLDQNNVLLLWIEKIGSAEEIVEL